MLMDVLTDFPERLQPGKTVYVGEAHEPMQIASVRGHDRELIIRLAGIRYSGRRRHGCRNAMLFVKSSRAAEAAGR